MLHYGKATLIYVASTKTEEGSPKEVFQYRETKVTETKTFSLNFYNSSGTLQRSMRKSKNIVVPVHLTEDLCVKGVRYELLYVDYLGLRYRVQNILHYRKSGLRMLLDIEELR